MSKIRASKRASRREHRFCLRDAAGFGRGERAVAVEQLGKRPAQLRIVAEDQDRAWQGHRFTPRATLLRQAGLPPSPPADFPRFSLAALPVFLSRRYLERYGISHRTRLCKNCPTLFEIGTERTAIMPLGSIGHEHSPVARLDLPR